MNKVILFFLMVFSMIHSVFAQHEEEEKGSFKRENIFIGTALNVGFSSGVFQIGANPEIGYSITRWLDAGISTNLNYTSFRYTGFSDRVFNYGGGTFVRIWPVRFLFITGQPEYNWITVTRKFTNGSLSLRSNVNAGSILLGAGYGNRIVGQAYSYFAILFDALENINSPYRDEENRALPIFRAGFAIYLRPGDQR